jgi:transcriptional regulator with XRE-family HTH domain
MDTLLKRKRLAAALTQRQMAEAAGMRPQAYGKKERGQRRITSAEAKVFARVLRCAMEEITE